MIPGSTLRLPLTLNEEAPADMYSALGKNDQKIYVVPSQNLVIVRMGNDPGDGLLGPSSFDTELWRHINRWRQVPTGIHTINSATPAYPNPCSDYLMMDEEAENAEIFDLQGNAIPIKQEGSRIDTSTLPNGMYILRYSHHSQPVTQKIIIQH